MEPIRVGVVGLRHGMACLHEVVKNPAFALAGLCSASDEAWRYLRGEPLQAPLESVTFTAAREELIAACRRHQDFSDVPFHREYRDLLADPSVEAVIIAPPIHLNASFATAALEAGKHVLASKPFAHTLEGALALARAVDAAPTHFMLGFEFRHAPLFERIKAALDAGTIGTLELMWWNMFRMPFRPSYGRRERSGGAFLAEICHWFDLFHLFSGGAPFARVAGFGDIAVHHHQDFQDNGVCIVDYAGGLRGSVNFTYFTDLPQHNLFGLVGTGGKIVGDTECAGRFTLTGADHARQETVISPAHAHSGHLGFDVLHARFAERVRGKERFNEAEAKAGLETTLLSIAAQEAMDTGVVITREALLARARG